MKNHQRSNDNCSEYEQNKQTITTWNPCLWRTTTTYNTHPMILETKKRTAMDRNGPKLPETTYKFNQNYSFSDYSHPIFCLSHNSICSFCNLKFHWAIFIILHLQFNNLYVKKKGEYKNTNICEKSSNAKYLNSYNLYYISMQKKKNHVIRHMLVSPFTHTFFSCLYKPVYTHTRTHTIEKKINKEREKAESKKKEALEIFLTCVNQILP